MADKDKDTAEKAAAEKVVLDRDAAAKVSDKKKIVTLRHKTSYQVYRRSGIVMTAQPKEYAVTAEQLAALKADAWVEVTEK